MSFGFKKFEDKSNFDFNKQFKNFENNPKDPSIYPRGSDGYALESEEVMNYIHLHNRY